MTAKSDDVRVESFCFCTLLRFWSYLPAELLL